jgi:hypothetical protein
MQRLEATSPKLRCTEAASVRDMSQLQLLESLALRVEIYAANLAFDLVETDVVEALEASTRDGSNTVVGNQEMLLPTHKDVLFLGWILSRKLAILDFLLQWPESGELGPVAQIDLSVGPPVLVLGKEAVFASNNLSLKISRECGVILGQAWIMLESDATNTTFHQPCMRK